MAKLLPDFTPDIHKTAGYRREIDVLRWLRQTLPDGYTVFHSVDWHSLYKGQDTHGEVDIIVMNLAGDLLLIEVKSGALDVRSGSLYKAYQNRERDVSVQLKVQYAAMRQLLQKAGLPGVRLRNCLLLPDWRVGEAAVVAIPRERILDADDYPQLSARVQYLLPLGESDELAGQVAAFLSNHLSVVSDVTALQGQLRETARHLADGLATWVPRLQASAGVFRVQATAGSGKTQLALSLLQQAQQCGQHALYVCFNRPLADHMAHLLSGRPQATTFHALCIDVYLSQGYAPEGFQSSTFEHAAEIYLAELDRALPDLDLLVIDEAQDFDQRWLAGLRKRLRPEGTLYVLEDADQSLYPRPALVLPEAVLIRCQDNFRSPRQVCNAINAFSLSSSPISARSTWTGEVPEIIQYDGSRADLIGKTEQAIRNLLEGGLAPEDIAVLSMRGHTHSELTRCERLADLQVRRFTGDYQTDGTPLWTSGRLLVESVYRFKGQSAAAVIVTEADFERLGPLERARLFVGMTRGWYVVTLVVSQRTAVLLAAEIDN